MQSNNQTFKAGDEVYFPRKSTNILKLKKTPNSKNFPIKIRQDNFESTFTLEGKEISPDKTSAIFHATKENCKKLSELYGIQFEKPKTFLDIHLERGSIVLCLIVMKDINYLPKFIWELDYDKCDIDVINEKVNDSYLSRSSVYGKIKDIYPIAIDGKGRITYLD